ncbi:MAG: transcription factor [Candidatus Bathyarchaeia archaeon]
MYIDDDVLVKVANIIGGEEALQVVTFLKKVDAATDDWIAEETGIRLNEVRKALFKLYDHSIILCNRVRDEKTGWFIFNWKLQPDQIEAYIRSQKMRVLEKLEARYQYENDHEFYHCLNPGCKRVTFEEALELIFRCPTCGKTLQHFDNSRIKEVLREKVEHIQKELRD